MLVSSLGAAAGGVCALSNETSCGPKVMAAPVAALFCKKRRRVSMLPKKRVSSQGISRPRGEEVASCSSDIVNVSWQRNEAVSTIWRESSRLAPGYVQGAAPKALRVSETCEMFEEAAMVGPCTSELPDPETGHT